MNESQIAIINLIAKLGLDAAIVVMEQLGTATTNDEAVAALKRARDKTAEQYLQEAAAKAPPVDNDHVAEGATKFGSDAS